MLTNTLHLHVQQTWSSSRVSCVLQPDITTHLASILFLAFLWNQRSRDIGCRQIWSTQYIQYVSTFFQRSKKFFFHFGNCREKLRCIIRCTKARYYFFSTCLLSFIHNIFNKRNISIIAFLINLEILPFYKKFFIALFRFYSFNILNFFILGICIQNISHKNMKYGCSLSTTTFLVEKLDTSLCKKKKLLTLLMLILLIFSRFFYNLYDILWKRTRCFCIILLLFYF